MTYGIKISNKWRFNGTIAEMMQCSGLPEECLCGKNIEERLQCDLDLLYPNLEII